MRAGAAQLPVATSLAEGLPEVFVEGDLLGHLVASLDAVLAPVVSTLDDLDAYVDPRYAPDDLVLWLATWLAAPVDGRWRAERLRRHLPDLRRALVARGTVAGLVGMLRALTGTEPEVSDNGGVATSARPRGPLPGTATPLLRVDVTIPRDDPDTMEDVVHRVVAEMTPAHVPTQVTMRRA